MFPPIKPFASGLLAVSDGNQLYWEASGNPDGLPALHLHGGPGGGMGTGYRRRFDPERFCIIGFEQRGCGRSLPLACDSGAPPLATNTSDALIADIEALREHLGVERWLLEGLSWGSALAIAYAQAYPERVSALALFAVCVGSAREIAWTTEGMRRILPREWEALARSVELQPGERLIDACYRRVTDPDPQNRAAAGTAWCAWEDAHMQLAPNGGQPLAEADPRFQLVFATLVTHYWAHAGFFGDPGLLGHVDRISHVPAVLIHGRLDVSLPVESAWRLHKQWPASELIVVEDEGHGGPRMIAELLAAIDRLGHVV